jgi:hypothetical protein
MSARSCSISDRPQRSRKGVPSKIAWTDTRTRHWSMMYANSPRLAREQGQRGCRKIRRVGPRLSSWIRLSVSQRLVGLPPSPGRAAYACSKRIPETTTAPQVASRTSERFLTRDRELISRLFNSVDSIGRNGMHPWRYSQSGTEFLPHRETTPVLTVSVKKHRPRSSPRAPATVFGCACGRAEPLK